MEIKILNSQTIKLTLTTKDMEKHNITYEILKNNEKITKNLILKLLNNIKDTLAIDVVNKKIFLESFKTKEKGCILYLSIPKTKEKTQKPIPKNNLANAIISIFKTTKNLKNFCKSLTNLHKNKKFKSELYNFENKFILVIFAMQNEEKEFIALSKEFGNIYGKGQIKHSIIREHCKLIFKENAVEKIIGSKS